MISSYSCSVSYKDFKVQVFLTLQVIFEQSFEEKVILPSIYVVFLLKTNKTGLLAVYLSNVTLFLIKLVYDWCGSYLLFLSAPPYIETLSVVSTASHQF